MIFRFPGSKAKFLASLAPFLDRLVEGKTVFHDVFTGGGSVALFMARRHPRLEICLNDLDLDLAAFWCVVAGERIEALCDRLDVRPSVDLFQELRGTRPKDNLDRAFRAVFFNRCCFSGLLDGSMLGGKWQASPNKVFSRYNPKRLIAEVTDAHRLLRGRTQIMRMDAAAYVARNPIEPKYLDPPYFAKGDKLFRERMILADHLRLSEALRCVSGWLLSYDNSPMIVEMYRWAEVHSFTAKYSVNGRKKAWARSTELLIAPPPPGAVA
jgi:DNA adenine methylase